MDNKYFIGIDSDGTIFDTMTIKHEKAFIPAALETWTFGALESQFIQYEREINLFSSKRGIDRFRGLYLLFQLLAQYVAHHHLDVTLPDYEALQSFLDCGQPLSNKTLKAYCEAHPTQFLSETLAWSLRADVLFAEATKTIAPFEHVKGIFAKVSEQCDITIISSATQHGLVNDMGHHGLSAYIKTVMGQEFGSKATQLSLCHLDRYENCLMIGDALGDYEAACENNISFYPMIPGKEATCWADFQQKIYPSFLSGTYKEVYEKTFVNDFIQSMGDISLT